MDVCGFCVRVHLPVVLFGRFGLFSLANGPCSLTPMSGHMGLCPSVDKQINIHTRQ